MIFMSISNAAMRSPFIPDVHSSVTELTLAKPISSMCFSMCFFSLGSVAVFMILCGG